MSQNFNLTDFIDELRVALSENFEMDNSDSDSFLIEAGDESLLEEEILRVAKETLLKEFDSSDDDDDEYYDAETWFPDGGELE